MVIGRDLRDRLSCGPNPPHRQFSRLQACQSADTMKNNFVSSLVASFALMHGASALELAADVAKAFSQASVGESGGLFTENEADRELLEEYVNANWRSLLESFSELQVRGKSQPAKISVVGILAENLPPVDYLDFLKRYLELVEEGKIPIDTLVYQIGGNGRKSDFLSVNHRHAEVESILAKAIALAEANRDSVSEDERSMLRSIADGSLADMYDVNESGDELPPETLPGVTLSRPYESLISRFNREKRAEKDATRRPMKEGEAFTETLGSRTLPWGALACTLLVLVLAVVMFLRRKIAKLNSL
jgi:DnaJ-domain-containing protein 1